MNLFGSSMTICGSATYILGLNEQLRDPMIIWGVSNETLGVSNEMVEMDDHNP